MTDYVKQLYSVKAISTGAALLLASVGMANAAPNDESFGSIEPKPVVAVQQQADHTVKGVVEDALGPVAGANVIEKGTTNGTITDADGNFTLNVSSPRFWLYPTSDTKTKKSL